LRYLVSNSNQILNVPHKYESIFLDAGRSTHLLM
jgi:phosphoserine aminotransferase